MHTIPLAASFVLTLLAQDPSPPRASELVELERADGTSVVAAVLAVDGDRVRLRMPVLGGHVEALQPLADFTPAARFRIATAAAPPDGFDARFAAAREAATLGLISDAGVQARAAAQALAGRPDADAKRGELQRWGADAVEAATRAAVAANDPVRARQALRILASRFADQRTDEQLDALATLVDDAEAKRAETRVREREARDAAKAENEADRALDAVAERVARGTKAYGAALRTRSTTTAARLCEQAIEHFTAAHRSLEKVLEDAPRGASTQRAFALGRELNDTGVAAALHAATMLGVQSDYRGAREWTQRVLAFDPGNADAKALMRTLTVAEAVAADDLRWGWTLGNLGRVGELPRPSDGSDR